jgi:isocitrate/isopropylmalate dehydrogenase
MILAAAALLGQTDDEHGRAAGSAIREAALEAIAQGTKTADLGGDAGTTEFTDEVIRRTRAKLS